MSTFVVGCALGRREGPVAGCLVFIVGDPVTCRLVRTDAVVAVVFRAFANLFIFSAMRRAPVLPERYGC